MLCDCKFCCRCKGRAHSHTDNDRHCSTLVCKYVCLAGWLQILLQVQGQGTLTNRQWQALFQFSVQICLFGWLQILLQVQGQGTLPHRQWQALFQFSVQVYVCLLGCRSCCKCKGRAHSQQSSAITALWTP